VILCAEENCEDGDELGRVIDGAGAVRFTSFLAAALADVPGLLRAIP
jgi:hypothetical protein